MNRSLYGLLGILAAALGVVGAILPVMPSTCFFILSAYCFSKSSQRFENWILEHPRFGHSVRGWREHKSISRVGKIAACTGMSVGMIFLLLTPVVGHVKIIGAIFILGSAVFILTRPTLRISESLKTGHPVDSV